MGGGKLSQEEVTKTIDFCFTAFEPTANEEEKQKVIKKSEAVTTEKDDEVGNANGPKKTVQHLETSLTEDEKRILNTIRARQMLRTEDIINIENLAADIIDGRKINLKRGSLGLVHATGSEKKEAVDVMALMIDDEGVSAMKKSAAINGQRPEVSVH